MIRLVQCAIGMRKPLSISFEIVKLLVTYGVSSFNENLENWLKKNGLSTTRHNTSIPWCTLFLIAVWCLWTNINKVVFENTILNPRLDKIYIGQAREYFFCVSKICQVSSKIVIPVRWTKPLVGWHKLNRDGAS